MDDHFTTFVVLCTISSVVFYFGLFYRPAHVHQLLKVVGELIKASVDCEQRWERKVKSAFE